MDDDRITTRATELAAATYSRYLWDARPAEEPSATLAITVGGGRISLDSISPWAFLDLANECTTIALDLQRAIDERDNEPLPGFGYGVG
jgi:hypothetical protein